ncbi:hypothetical protein U1Q18_030319 [Sarracenia purpurea var. burkii]
MAGSQQPQQSALAPSVASSGRQEQQDRTCYHCKQSGHRAKKCPQKKQAHGQPHGQQHQRQERGPPTCYHCREVGHLKRDCPRGGNGQGASGASQSFSQTQAPQMASVQSATLAPTGKPSTGRENTGQAHGGVLTIAETSTSTAPGGPDATTGPSLIRDLLLHQMDSSEAEYAAFEEKVRRTVYVDNLSPQVTESVLRTAFNQFGYVDNVQFIPNYTELKSIPRCALVEMQNSKQAEQIVVEIGNLPFMMSGMPRPIRARAADMEMFDERPKKPGRKIYCRWLDPEDSNFQVAKKLKHLTRKHAAEASFLLNHQQEEEEKLASQQDETLKANYKKFDLIEGVLNDGTADRLARRYDMKNFNAW